MGVDNGGGGGRVFRNNYRGHMDKTKVGWIQGKDVGMAGGGSVVGDKCRQLYLNNNKIILKSTGSIKKLKKKE